MQKPWNIPNQPVYSLATYYEDTVNMNICTYVTPVSMQPKLYAIGVYYNTQTWEYLLKSEFAVLQLLHESQEQLIRKLGKTSGLQYPKENYLDKKNLLTTWEGYRILHSLSAVVLLKKLWHQPAGDHELFVLEAIRYKSFNKEYLTLGQLRAKKIIRG